MELNIGDFGGFIEVLNAESILLMKGDNIFELI